MQPKILKLTTCVLLQINKSRVSKFRTNLCQDTSYFVQPSTHWGKTAHHIKSIHMILKQTWNPLNRSMSGDVLRSKLGHINQSADL